MRDDGFTLVELLVSLAIMGLMSVLMLQGVTFGTQVWNRAQLTDLQIEMPRVERFLIEQLSSIYPYKIVKDQPEFTGLPERIAYVAPALPQMALPGHYRYGLNSVNGDLVFAWCHLDICPTPTEFGVLAETSVLLGVEQFLLWYGQRHNGDIKWSATWPQQKHLPDFIKIRIKHRGGEFTTLIQPRIDHDARCIFDVVSQNCRDA